jgi:hypothetical protein
MSNRHLGAPDMEDDLDTPSPGEWDGVPENPDGEE